MNPSRPASNEISIESRRASVCAALDGVRSWTGRSVVTSATDRTRPRFATAGMHRTRVSEIRLSASRATAACVKRADLGTATSPSERRNPGASS